MAGLFRRGGDKKSSASSEKKLYLQQEGLILVYNLAGQVHMLSKLPPQSDICEWLATNTLQFFNQINTQYEVVSELCTASTCPTMSAGNITYEWQDSKNKKHVKLPAKQYIDSALSNIQKQLCEEAIFPTKFDMEFPQDLFQIIKKIYRYYFHILAHLYHNHFHEYLMLGVHDCLNTLFLHFVYFVQEFQLLDSRELNPLEEFIQKLILVDKDLQKHPPKEDEDVEPIICSKLKN